MFLSLTARPKRRHHRPEMSRKRYPVRIPRYASGIRAQEPRGGAGRSWWARRWTERLEAMGLGPRLGRGRHYAVSGQVVEMRMEGPLVTAKVVGTRPDPYTVTVAFRTPEGEARSRIVSAIASEPMLAARIMADDLPTEVEGFFRAEGLDLFPGGRLPDDPADHRGILSWFAQPRDGTLHEAGSYGYLVEAEIPSDALAQGKDGKLTIRLESEGRGLAVYGAKFGRFPFDPTVMILP